MQARLRGGCRPCPCPSARRLCSARRQRPSGASKRSNCHGWACSCETRTNTPTRQHAAGLLSLDLCPHFCRLVGRRRGLRQAATTAAAGLPPAGPPLHRHYSHWHRVDHDGAACPRWEPSGARQGGPAPRPTEVGREPRLSLAVPADATTVHRIASSRRRPPRRRRGRRQASKGSPARAPGHGGPPMPSESPRTREGGSSHPPRRGAEPQPTAARYPPAAAPPRARPTHRAPPKPRK